MSILRTNLLLAMNQAGITEYKLALEAMLSGSVVHLAFKGKRPFSNATLQAIAGVPELDVTYQQLIRWKLMDEYPDIWQTLLVPESASAVEPPLVSVPLVGIIQQGVLQWSVDSSSVPITPTEYVRCSAQFISTTLAKTCWVATVADNTMMPYLGKHSQLFFEPVKDIIADGLYLFQLEDASVVLRWAEPFGDLLRLIPYNRLFNVQETNRKTVQQAWRVVQLQAVLT
jgi:hypothetical protein